jgi:hypothetical protein
MWNVFAFMALGILIAWFRYDLERLAQSINAAYIRKAAHVGFAMALPGMFLMQAPGASGHWPPIRYFHAGALAAWIIYLGYIAILMAKFSRLKKEERELHE